MEVTDRSVTSRTVAQQIESITHHSVSVRTIRRRLQQSDLTARRPLLDLPLTQNHRRLRRQCSLQELLIGIKYCVHMEIAIPVKAIVLRNHGRLATSCLNTGIPVFTPVVLILEKKEKTVHSYSWDAQLAVPNDPRYARLETNLRIGQAKKLALGRRCMCGTHVVTGCQGHSLGLSWCH
ncbi:transposable element Tcb1 transposase [Trichonephila clavipes]|nr:transposable element Tcb1 transposase [Trichonephila clavipes]